jgi:hypothetical protein
MCSSLWEVPYHKEWRSRRRFICMFGTSVRSNSDENAAEKTPFIERSG